MAPPPTDRLRPSTVIRGAACGAWFRTGGVSTSRVVSFEGYANGRSCTSYAVVDEKAEIASETLGGCAHIRYVGDRVCTAVVAQTRADI